MVQSRISLILLKPRKKLSINTVLVLDFAECFAGQPSKDKTFVTLIQRRPNVFDVGPTLYKCHTNVLCLLGVWLLSAVSRLTGSSD